MCRTMRVLAWAAVLSLPMAAGAQSPFNAASDSGKISLPEIGGKTAIDLIPLEGPVTSVPLRNGGVVKGSEYVQLESQTLKNGTDYSVDYGTGVIYLMIRVRAGQSLRVQYRHDSTKALSGRSSYGSPGGFNFRITNGAEVAIGLGFAERSQDGSVVSSNVYGIKNNFSGKGGNLKGMYLLGERKKVQSQSLYDPVRDAADPNEGRSRAILQNLTSKAFGGSIEAGYQHIEEKFAGFQSFRDAGYDDAAVNQLSKERGIKRFGFNLSKIGAPGVNFSHGYRSVRDAKDKIEWRSLGLNAGPLQVEWFGQRVGAEFSRFNDLAESDREKLAKERGLNREHLAGKLNFSGGGASFSTLKVENGESAGVHRRSFELGYGGGKISYLDQEVQPGFTQFGGLREPDAGQLAREQGMRRQSLSISYKPLNFASSSIRTDAGRFNTLDLGFALGGFAFEHSVRQADKGFVSFANMSDAEITSHLVGIAKMYEPGSVQVSGNDKHWFFQSAGIERSASRFSGNLLGSKFSAEQTRIRSDLGIGSLSRITLDTGKFKFGFREQDLGDSFTDLGKLTEFERARLGNLVGLYRQDVSVAGDLSKSRSFAFSTTRAEAPNGGAFRQAFSVKDKSLELTWNRRSIDTKFVEVVQLLDPERDLMNSLRGFSQSELKLKWQVLPGLGLHVFRSDANSLDGLAGRLFHTATLDWKPDSKTALNYDTLMQREGETDHVQYDRDYRHIGLQRDLGKLGNISVSQDTKKHGGSEGTQPDSVQQSLIYETKLTDKTALRSEQSHTRYDNGERETTSSNTVSTEIGKKAGVSLTDTRIRRDGDKPDEQRRNYGFWWDLGGGLRLNYGYARNLNSGANGELKSQFSISPGAIGGLKIDSASYQINRWDTTRNHALGNVQLGTAKPLKLGFIQDFTFFFGANTNRDRGAWVQENRNFGLAGKIGSNSISFQYLGQIAQNQQRGIDRLFTFSTDQSEKQSFRANVKYKIRTLPEGKLLMIRDYSLNWRPFNGVELTHQLQTNPEQPRGDALLGSLAQPTSASRWKLDFLGNPSTKFGATWEEVINEQNKTRSRIGGVNLTLFANSPSPLLLYYGLEQLDNGGKRQTAHRYSLRFDQRPGPNQLFSLFVGNLSFQHSRPEKQRVQNWSARVEYQIRF